MPLSDREQQLLDQLEKQLNTDDSTFTSSWNDSSPHVSATDSSRISARGIIFSVLSVLLGLGLVVFGVASKLLVIGVVGFVVAAGGVYWASTRTVSSSPVDKNRGESATALSGDKNSFMRNLEDRWDKRQQERP